MWPVLTSDHGSNRAAERIRSAGLCWSLLLIEARRRAELDRAELAGIVLGAITVAASVLAGLLGPVAIAICAVIFGLPVWGAWWWLAHSG